MFGYVLLKINKHPIELKNARFVEQFPNQN